MVKKKVNPYKIKYSPNWKSGLRKLLILYKSDDLLLLDL